MNNFLTYFRKSRKEGYSTIIFFEPFLNSGFSFAILQSEGNIEYCRDKLQI